MSTRARSEQWWELGVIDDSTGAEQPISRTRSRRERDRYLRSESILRRYARECWSVGGRYDDGAQIYATAPIEVAQ